MSQDSCPETEGISDDEDRDGDEDEKDDRHFLRNATRTLIWDIAVGCLALSVKVSWFLFLR
jgi:hypothetical protein